MAYVGKKIEHPLTGERITFLETASSSGGARLRMAFDMGPGGDMPSVHTHPRAEETFAVTSGRLRIATAENTWDALAGDKVVIPPGMSHAWGNPYDEPATVLIDLCPAYQMETFFETFFGLAADGLVSAKTNLPKSPLQAAVLVHDYRGQVDLPGLSGVAVRALAAVVAPLGRLRGYRSRYPQYSDRHDA
ncbi:cupin domain-containing protein [Mycobacterium sp. CPCC 205372]|uniref:Cupin domain-containing protein n=1 Tax=Mycobacterium hippophais TaxID=3016340 RepID=A0ABT4PRJ5_9MYCO|nr:cupin domain-containing protein [Mycobacterium hippophais]MCZ8379181.1 cupin domain-containing protein [Mycobacterium hippophais]